MTGISSFATTLQTLARAAGLDVTYASIERACVACNVHPLTSTDWTEDVERVGAALGLRVRRLSLSAADVVGGDADGLTPLVARAAGVEGTLCVAIVGRIGSRTSIRLGDEPRTVNTSELASLLGVPPDQPIDWVSADLYATFGHGAGGGSAAGLPHDPGHHSSTGGHHHHPSPVRRLLALARLERDDVGIVVLYAAGVGIVSLATPLGVQVLVNTLAFGAFLQPILVLTLLVFAGLGFEGMLRALKYWVIERVQQRIFVRVALDIAYRLPRWRQEELDAHHGPEMVNRFFDVMTIQKGVATILSDGVSIVLYSLMGMLILAFYHPFLLGFDIALMLGFAVVFVFGRGGASSAIRESASKYEVAAWLEEAAKHRAALSLGGGAGYVAVRAERLTREWLDRRRTHWKVVFRQVVSMLALQALASAALLAIGGWLVFSRQLTLGQLVAAEIIVTSVVAGFAKLGKSFETYYDLVAASDKLGHLVDVDLVPVEGIKLSHEERGLAIEARNVCAARGHVGLVRDVNLHLKPGSRTVVYGGAGTGKSTFADVLAHARAPASGMLVVDDTPSTDISPIELRDVVALVRGPELFDGTIFENIAVGRPSIGRGDVRRAIDAVGLEPLVFQLPNGMDTQLTSDSSVLGHQAALLLTLARALAGSPRLLVLDGAFDGLDETTMRNVWRVISERPWTVLVTTSRRELIGLGDEAYVINGHRLERATRSTLRLSRPSLSQAAAEEA